MGEWTGRLFSASPEKDGGRVVSGKLIIWSRERQLCGFGKGNYAASGKATMWFRERQLCGFGKGNYFSNAGIYPVDV